MSSSNASLALLNQELVPLAKAFLGPVEVGILAAVCLYGVMLVQMYNYYVSTNLGDSMAVKALVAWVACLETAHTVLICTYFFGITVTNFGDAIVVGFSSTEYSASVSLSGVIGASVQSFFAYRTFVVAQNILIAVPAWIGALGRVGLAIALSVATIMSRTILSLELDHKGLVAATLAVSLVVDIINTGVLCVFLAHRRSGMTRMSLIVDKLIIWTLETGLASCVCAGLIISLWFLGEFGWAFCFISIYGKIYSNSLLVSLNMRNSLRGALSDELPGAMSTGRRIAFDIELGGRVLHSNSQDARRQSALIVSKQCDEMGSHL